MSNMSIASKCINVVYCFNDQWMVLFCVLFIYYWLKGKHLVAITLYSISISIKMSASLYLPGLILLLLFTFGLKRAFQYLSYIVIFQLLIAFPFLISNPYAYLTRAFNIDRSLIFEH